MTRRVPRLVGEGVRGGRPGPNDIQGDGQEPEPEGIGHELARLGREPQGAENIERGPPEGEPPDEERQAAKPEAGGGGGQRDDPEAVCILRSAAVRRQEKPAQDQNQAQNHGRDQIREDDLPQERRPVEGQEGADAPEPEDRHFAEAEGETQADGAHPLGHGFHGHGSDPLLRVGGDLPEEPFGSGAQGNEPEDKDQHAHEAAALQLGEQAIRGAAELARQARRGGREGGEVVPQARGSGRHHLGGVISVAVGGGSCKRRRRRGLLLLVDPAANGRILQEVQELLHLGRGRVLRRGGLGVGGRSPHEHEEQQRQAAKEPGRGVVGGVRRHHRNHHLSEDASLRTCARALYRDYLLRHIVLDRRSRSTTLVSASSRRPVTRN